jgi:hypothetical protein
VTTAAPAPIDPSERKLGADDLAKMWEARHIEHLRMLQAVIARLATHSFQLKAAAVSLVSALGAVAGWQNRLAAPMWGAFAVSLLFGYLDTWFLQRERMYRLLFEAVRKREPGTAGADVFDMSASPYAARAPWWGVFWSATLAPMYLLLTWGAGLLAWRWSSLTDARWWVFGLVLAAPLLLHGALGLRSPAAARGPRWPGV